MPSEPFLITIHYPIDEVGLGEVLRVSDDGRAELTVQTNESNLKVQEIGVYHHDIGEKQAVELKDTLLMLDRSGVPGSQPAPPGMPMVLVSLERGGITESRTLDPSSASPAICNTADRFDKVKEQTRKNPLRIVSMEAFFDKQTLLARSQLTMTLRLTSIGTEPVTAVNPVGKDSEKTGGFTVWGIRTDLPPADLWPQHSKHQRLTSTLPRRVEGMEQPDAPLLKLKPTQMALFEFSVPIEWEPGEYGVKVIFETLSEQSDILKGKIITYPQKVVVY